MGSDSAQGGLHHAGFTAYARYGPINAAVTLLNAVIVSLVMVTVLPWQWVVPYFGLHTVVAVRTWWGSSARARRRPQRRRSVRARLWTAVGWSLVAGLGWGAGVMYLPYLPSNAQLVVVINAVGVMGGASTTLAAIPAAAAAFICATALPYVAYFMAQGQIAYIALAALGVVYTLSMVGASRLVYGVLIQVMRAREANEDIVQRFRDERAEWQELTDTAEAFALYDEDNRLLLWNDTYQRVLGLPPGVLSRGASRVAVLEGATRPEDVERGQRPVRDWLDAQLALASAPGKTIEDRLTDGRVLRSSAHRTKSGRTVTVHVDVTELKRVEAELQSRESELLQSQKLEALGKLAGGIAHDFNNALTAILGYADSLRMHLEQTPELAHEAEQIARAAQNAAALTRQLLAFSRKQPLAPTVVDLGSVVAGLETLLRRLVPEDVPLTFELAREPLHVKVDRHQLEHAIVNLVLNARDAVGTQGGFVRVSTRRVTEGERPGDHTWCALAVNDSGAGMAPDVVSRVFEPFFTTKPTGHGAGLGLSTAYGIVRQSGGDLRVRSAPGQGTAFEILLPVTDEAPRGAIAEPTPPRPASAEGRILLAEDDEAVRRILARALREAGYQVIEAERGDRAVELLRAHRERLTMVVSDVVMPGLRGDEVAAEVARIAPGLPVILMSGYSDQLAEAATRPNVTMLAKPMSVRDLLARIRAIVEASASFASQRPPSAGRRPLGGSI